MSAVIAACIAQASYNAFYDLIACALETCNTGKALERVAEAREYLTQHDLNRLVAEIEADYHEFT